MPRTSPTLADTLRAALDARLTRLRVALPGIVRTYDHARQRADVQPAVQDAVYDEGGVRVAETLPVVTEVPVVFQGGAGGGMTFPLSPGDEGLLLFSSSSLDRWLSRGGVVDPGDDRKHHLSDAVFLPGLRHAPLPAAAVGSGVVVRGDLQLGSSAAAQGVFLSTAYSSAFDTLIGAIATAAAGTGGGVTTAINTALTTFHATDALMISSKVKAE